MKIGGIRKLRSWCLRKRNHASDQYCAEPLGPMNLYRPRLAGKVETYDAVINFIDGILKRHHDKWHDRSKS